MFVTNEIEGLYSFIQDYLNTNAFSLTPLQGDGSDRKIYRIQLDKQNQNTLIAIFHKNIEENKDFIHLGNHLFNNHVSVPKIYKTSENKHYYLLEDLGDETFAKKIKVWIENNERENVIETYQKVILDLIQLQKVGIQNITSFFETKIMDEAFYKLDITYFKEQFLKRMGYSGHFGTKQEEELNAIIQQIAAVPSHSFVHRDFQPRNMMMYQEKLFYIDFQSALQGTIYYDLASLLYSSTSNLQPEEHEALIQYYYEHTQLEISYVEFHRTLDLFILMRRLRSLGSYTFLSMVKGKIHFMKSIPKTFQELIILWEKSTSLQEFEALKQMLDTLSKLSYPIPG